MQPATDHVSSGLSQRCRQLGASGLKSSREGSTIASPGLGQVRASTAATAVSSAPNDSSVSTAARMGRLRGSRHLGGVDAWYAHADAVRSLDIAASMTCLSRCVTHGSLALEQP
mgnify:CR=1 FL=1